MGEEEEEDGDVKEDSGVMTEIRLVPPDISQCEFSEFCSSLKHITHTHSLTHTHTHTHTVETIFQAISECQALYPDSEQMSSEEEEELCEEEEEDVDLQGGDFFTSPEGIQHLTPEGQTVLEHLERVFQLPSPGEFSEMVANGELSSWVADLVHT